MNLNTKLLSREKEKEEILYHLSESEIGKGKIVIIGGEAGVGKTTIVENILNENNMVYYTGRSIEDYSQPYGIVSSALRECITKNASGNKTKYNFPKFINYLLPEYGKPPKEINRELLAQSIIATFRIMNKEKAVIVLFDDLQWADNATLEILPLLREQITNDNMIIFATYRNEEIPRGHKLRWLRSELRRKKILNEIILNTFSKKETEQFIKTILGLAPSNKLLKLIFEQTEGLPFYIEELCSTLKENKKLFIHDNKIDLVSGGSLIVPDSIKDLVLLKLDVMDEATREQLDIAAVAGFEFDLNLVHSLSKDKNLDKLLSSNIVFEIENNKARFKHALTREAVLSEILWSYKRKLNGEIASYLEKEGAPLEEISKHWLNANETEKARSLLIKSAQNSCSIHAYRDASLSATKALEIWPEGVDERERIDTLVNLAHCAKVSGDLSAAINALKETIQSEVIKEDFLKQGKILSELAALNGMIGSNEQSFKLRINSAEVYEKINMFNEAAIELLAGASKGTLLLKLDEAVSFCEKSYKLADKNKRYDIQARALGLKGNIYSILGKSDEGIKIVNKGLKLALTNNKNDAAAEVYRRLGSTLEYASQFQESKKVYNTAYNFCISNGEDTEAQVCLSCMVYVLLRTGDWKQCMEIGREILNDPDSHIASIGIAKIILGVIKIYRGEIKTARNYLEYGYKQAKKYKAKAIIPICLLGLALLADFDKDYELAENYFDEINEFRKKWNDCHDTVPGLTYAVTFFAERNQLNRASIFIDALAHIASTNNNEENLASFEYALGEYALADKNYKEAVKRFEQSIKHLNNLETPSDLVLAKYKNGLAYLYLGKKEKAIENLSLAYSITKKMGMRPMASKISQSLSTLGINPDSRKTDTADIRLTSRQMDILRLLPKGFSNKEISQQLFLSIRTVDMHVSNILSRLDCRSRTEAIKKAKDLNII